ncbi:hypothetical protein BJ508DRAFT_416078 [Ascobolus immersus RN42]|uniref:Cytochrome c oxidase copper chaperone n=1 Tax=Ascobolus immersus RN42 TaxID=1160509 RepID=A0A3N4HZ38_ASCIM|nr:hypothetical protein BJ508DRAFT_416078 [Ascobolus immersus RN42]
MGFLDSIFGGSKEAPKPQTVSSKPADKPKPCCVCKEEKAKRDECMLMNEDGEKACQPIIQEYKKCMKGFGFDV